MPDKAGDKIARAYARLMALKDNLPEHKVAETYVVEYHESLRHLEELGFDLEEFKIPPKQVRPTITSGNYLTGQVTYSKGRFVARPYLMTKLCAVLSYFDFKMQQQKGSESERQIGFLGIRK